jgi:hypothetical protein
MTPWFEVQALHDECPHPGPSYICGDNMSVIHNSQRLNSTLRKKRHSICYHAAREFVAIGELLTQSQLIRMLQIRSPRSSMIRRRDALLMKFSMTSILTCMLSGVFCYGTFVQTYFMGLKICLKGLKRVICDVPSQCRMTSPVQV